MAETTDVPAVLRALADQVPVDILGRLDKGELIARCEEVRRLLNDVGNAPDGMTAKGNATRAALMLEALPAAEVEKQARQLREQAIRVECSADSGAYLEAARRLEADNPQPPKMRARARLGETPNTVKQTDTAKQADRPAEPTSDGEPDEQPQTMDFLAKGARTDVRAALEADITKAVRDAMAPVLTAGRAALDQIEAGIADARRVREQADQDNRSRL